MDKVDRKIEVIKWVVFVLLMISGFFVLKSFYLLYQNKRNNELLNFAYIVKSAVNPDEVAQLKGDESDLTNPNYIRLKEQFSSIVDSAQGVRYLYMMGYDEKRSSDYVFFYLDSQPKKVKGMETDPTELAKPGEIYDDGDLRIKDVYKNGGELVINEPYTDKWGTFVSAMVPISERGTGKILAVVGADFEIGNQVVEVAEMLSTEILVFFLVIVSNFMIFASLQNRRKIENSANVMASVLEYSQDAIYSSDINGLITMWNKAAEKLYGYKSEEVIGKNIRITAPKELVWQIDEHILTVKEGKSIVNKRVIRKDRWGKTIEIMVNALPIYNRSMEVVGISIIARDLGNESLEKSELEKKNKEMEKMNNMMIERELKMIELKKKIEELEGGYGVK